MNELKEKEAQAIKVLRTFEPEEGYVLAYSGGKKMKEELEQHPRYARMYFRATDRMLKSRMEQGKELPLAWGDGKPETVMKWWLEN